MPIYDYLCPAEHIHERYARVDEEVFDCPECGDKAKRIISLGGPSTTNEDAPWIRSVLEVVEKDGHCRVSNEFLKYPTRTNYKRWMKEKGIRPMENERGGPPGFKKPAPPDEKAITDATYERYRKKTALEVGNRWFSLASII
jgi:putative FmdB family regulatory protein